MHLEISQAHDIKHEDVKARVKKEYAARVMERRKHYYSYEHLGCSTRSLHSWNSRLNEGRALVYGPAHEEAADNAREARTMS